MRGYFPFQLVRFVDQGLKFFIGVLIRSDSVALRQHAARRTRLDDVSSVLNLITHRSTNLLWPIGDAFFDTGIEEPGSKTILIAVTAAHADGMTGTHHSRSGRPTFVDGFA